MALGTRLIIFRRHPWPPFRAATIPDGYDIHEAQCWEPEDDDEWLVDLDESSEFEVMLGNEVYTETYDYLG